MDDLRCSACGRPLAREPEAAISGSILGDECTDCYHRCPGCGAYTVVSWREAFCGEEQASVTGPLDPEAGRRCVVRIRGCDRPWDKRCRCPAHRAHFNDQLD